MLKNASLVAKISADTPQHEQHLLNNWQNLGNIRIAEAIGVSSLRIPRSLRTMSPGHVVPDNLPLLRGTGLLLRRNSCLREIRACLYPRLERGRTRGLRWRPLAGHLSDLRRWAEHRPIFEAARARWVDQLSVFWSHFIPFSLCSQTESFYAVPWPSVQWQVSQKSKKTEALGSLELPFQKCPGPDRHRQNRWKKHWEPIWVAIVQSRIDGERIVNGAHRSARVSPPASLSQISPAASLMSRSVNSTFEVRIKEF